ncbi:MAG TPA: esterase-like activity of phytase family protein [Allosphingosinicella sp.]|nr:esterase-like activity of phytase family protein [Allosphingosinicella sp.]
MKRRALRILFLLGAFVILATVVAPPPRRPALGPGESALMAIPVSLDAANPGRRRAGALHFRRGWQLTSHDPRFGGLSAIHVANDEVIALTDSGVVMSFDYPGSSADRRVRFTPLAGPGRAVRRNRDTESLALRGNHAWVGFERHNMVWRYRTDDWTAEAAARPAAIRRWRRNSGAETLVALADGRFLAIAEGRDGARFSEVVLFAGDPAEAETAAVTLRYRRLEGFLPTDAAVLPDGRLLVLNRSISLFGGMAAKLAIVDLASLQPGTVLEGQEISALTPPLTVDNMEALSIAREDGRILVRIASDDNYLALQRTLLLEFELDERALPSDRKVRPAALTP